MNQMKEKVLLLRLTEIFNIYGTGIVTGRNQLTLKNSRKEINETVKLLTDRNVDDEKARAIFQLGDDTRDWQVASARKDLMDFGYNHENIVPILVRPFYHLFTYYTGKTRGFHCMPRPDIMSHMLKDNMCLITTKEIKDIEFSHAFISQTLVETRAITQNSHIFPLFLYSKNKDDLITKQSNLKMTGSHRTGTGTVSLTDAEDFFFFIYGVLFSNTYRKIFENVFKIGFPPVPFTGDQEIFHEMSKLGKQLADIHLLNSTQTFNEIFKKYCGWGKHSDTDTDSADINIDVNVDSTSGYRFKIPRKVWEYQLGGHQIVKKTLDLKREEWTKLSGISEKEVMEFLKIIQAVELTIAIQDQIDSTFKQMIAS
jgi:predicted helicase